MLIYGYCLILKYKILRIIGYNYPVLGTKNVDNLEKK